MDQLEETKRLHDRPSRIPLGPRRPKTAGPPHHDAAVQAPSTPPPTPTPQKTPATTFIPPPPLTPAPPVLFEPTTIPWKGLPLDAAQWSFSSSELQEIVSKAIRLSARDSFVRLLSLQSVEADIPIELERLETARLEAQAKWRFEVGRRTMLLHALNASAAFSAATPPSEHPGETGLGNPIASFVAQLAAAIAACDSLFSTILQISDQQAQLALIQHQHWASALGMALRKLKNAHERQTQELKDAQTRVQTLEDELEEAWREAEKMAIEFDDLEQEIADSESEVVDEDEEQEQEVAAHRVSTSKHDPDETGTLGDMTINTDIGVVLGVTATAVVSKATLVTSGSPKAADKFDTESVPSVKSTRSRRSTRDGPSHVARISSARLRSRAASNASLRLPKALRSTPSTHTSPDDAPPMPALPSPTTQGQQSFLDMDNITQDHRKSLPPRHPEPTVALPTPPHSAGLPETRLPSIWLETDGAGKITELNTPVQDRTNVLQIFSALAPSKMRRSNLVMSLTGCDRSSDGGGVGSASGSASGSGSGSSSASGPVSPSVEHPTEQLSPGYTRTPSPTSNHSPVSLPTHALAHFRGPSLSSTQSMRVAPRPGSAGARLTTTCEEHLGTPRAAARTKMGLLGVGTNTSTRSLVSRASSVILRRLSRSQATPTGVGSTSGNSALMSPPRPREVLRLSGTGRSLVERWKDRTREGERYRLHESNAEEAEGEVMLIGSPHVDPFDTL